MKMTAFNFVHFADVVQTVRSCGLQAVCGSIRAFYICGSMG